MNYKLENWQIALIKDIKDYLDICQWNKTQKQHNSPFDNTGESFSTKKLFIKAYDWNKENIWNLKYGKIEISWYKYLGRGMSINQMLTNYEWIDLYNNIRKDIQSNFKKYAPDIKE